MLAPDGVVDRVLSEDGIAARLIAKDGPADRVLSDGGVVDRLLSTGGILDRLLEPGGPADRVLADGGVVRVIEPAWKMLLSNKAILPVLWRLNPGHALLCEAHADRHGFGRPLRVVAKPKLGREGANVSIADLDAQGKALPWPASARQAAMQQQCER